MEACNFGPRTGLGGLACLDWDWEFLGIPLEQAFWRPEQKLSPIEHLTWVTACSTSLLRRKTPAHLSVGCIWSLKTAATLLLVVLLRMWMAKNNPTSKLLKRRSKVDNSILSDTRTFLAKQLERYDFLRFNCVSSVANRKHICLDHNQRLAIVQLMLSKDFLDEEIHDFFKTVYAPGGRRDYDSGITQTQIASARGFHEKGGRPNPCSARTNPETGHISTPLFQIFGCTAEECANCLRKTKVVRLKRANSRSLKRS